MINIIIFSIISTFLIVAFLYLDSSKDEEDIEMANRLGIGLIEIDIKKKSCEEVLTAKHQQPVEGLFIHVAYALGYEKCSICKEFFKHVVEGSRRSPSRALKENKPYYVQLEKDVYYTKSNERWPVVICKRCLKDLEYGK